MPAGQLLGSSGIGGELDSSCEAAVVRTSWREREGEKECEKLESRKALFPSAISYM